MGRWVKFESAWWPYVAASLEQPWPEEACLFDLRWHAARGELPGRTVCAERWGCSPHRARAILTSEEWQAELLAASHEKDERQESADSRQPTPTVDTVADTDLCITEHGADQDTQRVVIAMITPASDKANADNQQIFASVSPAPIYRDQDHAELPDASAREAFRVVGAGTRRPLDEGSPVVAELLALEREDGSPVWRHQARDTDALLTSLRNGRTADWHHQLMAIAIARNLRRCRWSTLLGGRFADLHAEADRLAARQPDPTPAIVLTPRGPTPNRRIRT